MGLVKARLICELLEKPETVHTPNASIELPGDKKPHLVIFIVTRTLVTVDVNPAILS